MAWTEQEVVKYVLTRLGQPARVVEIDPLSISEALKKAVRTYSEFRPIIRRGSVQVFSGKQAYDFNLLQLPYGKGLLSAVQEPITSPQAVLSEFEYYRLRQPPYVDLSELITDRLYYKEVGILTGVDFDWEWRQESALLIVTPNPNRSFKVGYEYNSDATSLDDIPTRDQSWVADYTLAISKEMLGRVRGKFKGVPGNEIPIDTDAEALLSESKEELTALMERLLRRGDWTPPVRG